MTCETEITRFCLIVTFQCIFITGNSFLEEQQWPNRIDNTMEARVSGHSQDAKKGVRNWNWPLAKGVTKGVKVVADKSSSVPSYKTNTDQLQN